MKRSGKRERRTKIAKKRGRPPKSRVAQDGREPASHRNEEEDRMLASLDNLADYEEFTHNMAPRLRQLIQSGATSEELMEAFASMATARLIAIAMTSQDTGRALAAVQDILNRVHGKATERKEINHRMSKLDDDEFEQMIASLEEDVKSLERKKH